MTDTTVGLEPGHVDSLRYDLFKELHTLSDNITMTLGGAFGGPERMDRAKVDKAGMDIARFRQIADVLDTIGWRLGTPPRATSITLDRSFLLRWCERMREYALDVLGDFDPSWHGEQSRNTLAFAERVLEAEGAH
jgi:hypothetical protein